MPALLAAPAVRPAGALAAILAAGWLAPAPAPVVAPLARGLAIARTLRDSGTVALTFDDGPHPQGTPAILDVLAGRGVAATFFVVGEQVRRNRSLLEEIRAAGHAVAIHGDRHRCLLAMTPRMLRDDLDRAAGTIGSASALHRAPYGIYSWAGLAAVRSRGLAPVLWSAWGRDWARAATGAGIAARVQREVDGGGIVLLHDADDYSVPGCWRATAAALPRILDAIAARGLRPVTLAPDQLRGR